MAHIDALIDKVADPALRQMLRDQVSTLLTKQSFGLVFQAHKPETVELHGYRVKRGCKVRVQREDDGRLYVVERISDGVATIVAVDEAAERWTVQSSELVVVREFGEPMFPGLRSVGRIDGDDDKPPHIVINAENFHALETLRYTHEGKVDAIYIDPPYNSGARDWKYNNDYVDAVDQYRHSKWLAMMARRLKLAGYLLARDSTLIVTIDENEIHHLGMLLEQMFPQAKMQMVTIVINAPGQPRKQELARVEEYAFFLFFGDAAPHPSQDDLLNERPSGNPDVIRWSSLLRSGTNSRRVDRNNLFYPIFIDPDARSLVEIGEPKSVDAPRTAWEVPRGTVAIWPIKSDGSEGRWRVQPNSLRKLFGDGHAKLGDYRVETGKGVVWYLGQAARKGIETGEIVVTGKDATGAVVVEPKARGAAGRRTTVPTTVWNRASHHAGWHGSALVRALLPGRDFPFPKALYAVEDALRIAVGGKRDAVVLDFFAGSGTTAHAVARLNERDGGSRQCLLVSNNEVSPAESSDLTAEGHRPGDEAWEQRGIFYQFTMPRVIAALTGTTADGQPVPGEYIDGSIISDGLHGSAEFFELMYEDPDLVSLGRKFTAIAPLLWLKAGGVGTRIDKITGKWVAPIGAVYGVLFDVDDWRNFVDAVWDHQQVTHTFIVTDSESAFQQIAAELPNTTNTQLYEDYLHTFEINTTGSL
jgi:adenine-specific DNA-methyltransferase